MHIFKNVFTFISPGSVNEESRITFINVSGRHQHVNSDLMSENINTDSLKHMDAVSVEIKSLGI